MDDFDKYKFLLGETISLYQFIENDLKLIYAGLLNGDYYKNLEMIRNTYKGLGQIIIALQELDNSDGKPLFSSSSYDLLNKLARQRNYYCHQCCLDFCYDPDFRNSIEFKESCNKLFQTNASIKNIQSQTEKARQMVLTKLNRV